MAQGKLEVLLVSAKGLSSTDIITNMDPYVVITCRTREKKSSIASGKGTNPKWNETFLFNITRGTSKLEVKIFYCDKISVDDFLGETIINLDPVFHTGSIEPTSYNVVKDKEYCGEIKVGLMFTRETSRGFRRDEDDVGGWIHSSRN